MNSFVRYIQCIQRRKVLTLDCVEKKQHYFSIFRPLVDLIEQTHKIGNFFLLTPSLTNK